MKSKLRTLFLLLILPFVLTACTPQDLPVIGKFLGKSPLSGPVTITYWGLWEKPDTVGTLAEKYKKTHPNATVKYEDMSVLNLIDYKERIFSRAGGASGPDIAKVHISWLPRLKDSLAPMPSKLMSLDAYKKAFYPIVAQNAVFDDKIYGVPLNYDGLVLVYNKKHFEDAGISEAPTAWEEFRRLALELTVRGNGGGLVRSGAAIGNADNIDHFSDILGLMWAQAGVKFPADVDSRNAQDALDFYTNFIKLDGVWNPEFPESVTAFVNAQTSMVFVPSWRILEILNAKPGFDIGVAPVPQALPETPVSWGTFWIDVVPKNSANSQAAWEFLNFLAQEEQQRDFFNEVSKIRSFGAPYSLVSLGGELNSNQYLGAVVKTAPFAKSFEVAGRSGNRRQYDALKAAVNAVLGGATSEDALKKAKEELSK